MANVIGEPLLKFVQDQIETRQKAQGSGVASYRTPEQISYLNSKTAWIKMASAVEVSSKRIEAEGLRSDFNESGLAKYAVLFDGVSRLNGKELIPRGSVFGKNGIWDYYDGAYSVSANKNENVSEFGLAPMPGIESVDIKCINRGSTKKASVKLKCYTPEQFKIIDLLYLRIGYTMFIEWGWAPYLDNNGNLKSDYFTLIEDPDGFFSPKWKNSSYLKFLAKINGYKKDKSGNYDGLICKVTNFNWTISQDGSYDIDIQLISLGDVIESLKTNITPRYDMNIFLRSAYVLFDQGDEETQNVVPAPFDNIVSAYLFFQKLYLSTNPSIKDKWNDTENPEVYSYVNEPPKEKLTLGGVFITPTPESELKLGPSELPDKDFDSREEALKWLKSEIGNLEGYVESDDFDNNPNAYYIDEKFLGGVSLSVQSTPEVQTFETNQGKKDVVYLNYNNEKDSEINDSGFYMRFGHLLSFIQSYVVPKIENSLTPILNIDFNQWTNKMYTFPYQVSLDPRVCIVNGGENVRNKSFFPTLKSFKSSADVNVEKRCAYPMNIYVSHNQILNSLQNNMDDEGNVGLFGFLSDICTALNKALGGLNNLEPVINEETNTLKIIDGSYSSPKQPGYALELYGYNGAQSNFVRNFTIKTEITNDFATMTTIGSTAGGYVKGTENTMFSKWNKGLKDRFKEKIVAADKKSREKQDDGRDDPNAAYYKDFWTQRYNAFGYIKKDVAGWFTGDAAALSDEIIDQNVATVTEFYRYCNAKLQELDEKYASPSKGFVPISLNATVDGISGVKIYNEINVDTRFLPSNYPEALRFIITQVNHKISDNDWETSFETVAITNSENDNSKIYKPNTTFVSNEINSGNENGAIGNAVENEINSLNDNSSNNSTQNKNSKNSYNQNNSPDTSYKYEGKLPQKVSGTFKGDNGDRTHAFQSTNGAVVGGMQTKINKVLKEIYNKGINPDITNIKVVIDLKKKETSWEATLDKSKDGKAYVGLVTVGSCQSNDPFKRAQDQVEKALTWNGSPANHTLITDMKTTPDGQSNGNITIKGGKYILRQFFYKYTKSNKPPRK